MLPLFYAVGSVPQRLSAFKAFCLSLIIIITMINQKATEEDQMYFGQELETQLCVPSLETTIVRPSDTDDCLYGGNPFSVDKHEL